MEETKEKKETQVKPTTIFYSFLIALALIFIIFGILIYGLGKNYPIMKKVESVIPFPAAIINNSQIITIRELNSNLLSVKQFYESQDFSKVNIRIDFSTEEGKKRLKMKEKEIFNRMIEDKATEIIAKKNGIIITEEDVFQNLDRKLKEYGNEQDLKENLKRLYSWSISDFEKKVVEPDLYRQALEKFFSEHNDSIPKAKAEIEKAKSELEKKKLFIDVAKKYSQGATADQGGELGWFKKDQLAPEIADQIFSLSKGSRSEILESSLGFHIIEMEERKTDSDTELVRLRQIFVPKKTFAEYLTEEMKKIKFRILLKEYAWNTTSQMIDFKSEEMRNFEEETIKNAQGDASVLF